MKVKELLALLKGYDPESKVVLQREDSVCFIPIGVDSKWGFLREVDDGCGDGGLGEYLAFIERDRFLDGAFMRTLYKIKPDHEWKEVEKEFSVGITIGTVGSLCKIDVTIHGFLQEIEKIKRNSYRSELEQSQKIATIERKIMVFRDIRKICTSSAFTEALDLEIKRSIALCSECVMVSFDFVAEHGDY